MCVGQDVWSAFSNRVFITGTSFAGVVTAGLRLRLEISATAGNPFFRDGPGRAQGVGAAVVVTSPSTSSPNLSSLAWPMPGISTSAATVPGFCSAMAARVASVKTQ